MQGHVGKHPPQRRYQHGGDTRSQDIRRVLDGKIVNSHVRDIFCQIDVILEIVLALVGVLYVPHVREGNLHEPTGATGGINSEL